MHSFAFPWKHVSAQIWPCAGLIPFFGLMALVRGNEPVPDAVLFRFDDAASVSPWKPIKLADVETEQPAPQIEFSPAAKAPANGGGALQFTFQGGDWPAVATTKISVAGNWQAYHTLLAELTVDRPGVAYFRILQSKLDDEPKRAPWQRTMILEPGRNEVALTIRHGLGSAIIDPKRGDITSFIIGMFRPQDGQTLTVSNIRLTSDWPEPRITGWYSPYNHDGYSSSVAREFQRTGKITRFRVLGSDLEVADLPELLKLKQESWSRPKPKTIDQVEAEFQAGFDAMKPQHPRALMAILRDGERGYNPVRPDESYVGWSMVYISSHGPDGPNRGREQTPQLGETHEAFMRHRVMLMRADLAGIPAGSAILAARLVVTRERAKDRNVADKPNLWVVEPSNRAWDSASANCYFYAPGKLWRAVNGLYYGEDPDSWPVFAAHGPAGDGPANVLDFTEALRFWIGGEHANHGFYLHCQNDYMRMYTHRAKDIKHRPAILVIYEPK